jgi:hypothetical protein
MRVRAVIGALGSAGFDTNSYHPEREEERSGATHTPGLRTTSQNYLRSRLATLKRSFLPMPTSVAQRSRKLSKDVANFAPDIVYTGNVSQAQFGHVAGARHWMDFMDLWSAFGRREAQARALIFRTTASLQAQWLEISEQRICRTAWSVTAAGWRDYEILRRRGVEALWLPTPIDSKGISSPKTVNRVLPKRGTAGFLGNFNFWPNRDALDLLSQRWTADLVQQGWHVVIAGRGSEMLDRRRLHPSIEVIGEIDDLAEYYASIDISLAPIRLGGGVKTKVTESLCFKVPVIGTVEAFEGISPDLLGSGSIRVGGTLPELSGRVVLIGPGIGERFSVDRFNADIRTMLERV